MIEPTDSAWYVWTLKLRLLLLTWSLDQRTVFFAGRWLLLFLEMIYHIDEANIKLKWSKTLFINWSALESKKIDYSLYSKLHSLLRAVLCCSFSLSIDYSTLLFMAFAQRLTGWHGWSLKSNQGRVPVLPTPVAFLGIEPTIHCKEALCSNLLLTHGVWITSNHIIRAVVLALDLLDSSANSARYPWMTWEYQSQQGGGVNIQPERTRQASSALQSPKPNFLRNVALNLSIRQFFFANC